MTKYNYIIIFDWKIKSTIKKYVLLNYLLFNKNNILLLLLILVYKNNFKITNVLKPFILTENFTKLLFCL